MTHTRACLKQTVVLLLTLAFSLQTSLAAEQKQPPPPQKPEQQKSQKEQKPQKQNAQQEKTLHEKIDRLIAEKTPDYGKIAAPVASDAEFLRRVTLDLTGRIPTAEQTRKFLNDSSPNKRAKLIDRLLDSPEYARHMQQVFDVIFMRRLRAKEVKEAKWDRFLLKSFAENKSWDQICQDILSADGADPENRGPARFYLDRGGDMNTITRDVGRIFLGADLECAQCHNHPEVFDWQQDHYYGIAAFFNRSFIFKDKDKKISIFAEKAEGEVAFKSVFEVENKDTDGDKSTPPKLFEQAALKEPDFKKDEAYKVKPDKKKNVRPIPKFSRREKAAQMIASADNPRFVRTSANRFWALMMGRGLVHPIDMDHSGNPPSHPKLLKLLTDELAAREFNVKSFLRELALSKTYQRSSRNPAIEDANEQPPEETFAQAILKPLSPEEFAWAVLQATGEADVQRNALGDKFTAQKLYKKLDGYENKFVNLFGGEPGKPPEGFRSTADQVLFLSNDNTVQKLIRKKNGNFADRLLKLPEDKPQAIAEELFISALTRKPTKQEIEEVTAYLKGLTGKERTEAVQQLVWALVASSEFRFNH